MTTDDVHGLSPKEDKMKKRLYGIPISALIVFAFVMADANGQEGRPGSGLSGAEAVIERIKQQQLSSEDVEIGKISVTMCQYFFTVDYVDENPHMEIGDQFLIVGPNPISGQYQVTAVPPHQWKGPPNHYQAVPTTDPDFFDLWTVVVDPHNGGGAQQHYYQMEVTDWDDGCPKYVMFTSVAHIPGAIILDPGHGGAVR